MKENEVRYCITDEQKKKIQELTKVINEEENLLDITYGYNGFDSLRINGYICRIRIKKNKINLEIKKYISKEECIEESISLSSIKNGDTFLKLLGMKPYLYLNKNREERAYENLKIFIDSFDILGNYVEIEYQNSTKDDVIKFINLIGIQNQEQDLYGDIISERLKSDKEFSDVFYRKLEETINENIFSHILLKNMD